MDPLSIYGRGAYDAAEGFYAEGSTGTAPPPSTISPSGIASAETFGAVSVAGLIWPSSVTSVEAFGGAALSAGLIHPAGIASAEDPGVPLVNTSDQTWISLRVFGIATVEAFGSAKVNLSVAASGIGTAEAFGGAAALHTAHPSGIGSAEAFGTATLYLNRIHPTGIASAEAFGTVSVIHAIHAEGIPCPRASVGTVITSTNSGPYLIDDTNDSLPIIVDGILQTFALTRGSRTAEQIVADLVGLDGARAYAGSVVVRPQDGYWRGHRGEPAVTIPPSPAASVIGLEPGTYGGVSSYVAAGPTEAMKTIAVFVDKKFTKTMSRSVRISWRTDHRNTASFNVISLSGGAGPQVGQSVRILNKGIAVFAGTIESVNASMIPNVTDVGNVFEVEASSWEARMDNRLIPPRAYISDRASADPASSTFSSPNGSHTYSQGSAIQFTNTGGALPGGITADTTYYVIWKSDTTFQVSTTPGGDPVTFADGGSGETASGWTAGSIIDHAIGNYASGDGVTFAEIQSGASISSYVTEGCLASDLLADMCQRSNYIWYCKIDGGLRFIPQETYTAPWEVADGATHILCTNGRSTFSLRYTRDNLCNRAVSNLQWDALPPKVWDWTGNSTDREFLLGGPDATKAKEEWWPIGIEKITLNDAEQTWGVYGVDTGKDWYWRPGDLLIRQDPAGVVVATGVKVSVSYRVLGKNQVTAQNSTSIAERAVVEGTTGKYERMFDPAATNVADEQARLDQVVEERGAVAKEASYGTDEPGLLPGMLQKITLARLTLSENFLITNVDAADSETDGMALRYSVRAVSGSSPDAISYFSAGFNNGTKPTIVGRPINPAGAITPATFIIGLGGPAAAGSDICTPLQVRQAGRLAELLGRAKTAGGTFDILRSRDGGSTWVSVLGSSFVVASDGTEARTTTFAGSPGDLLSVGDWLRLDMLSGAAQDCTLVLRWV